MMISSRKFLHIVAGIVICALILSSWWMYSSSHTVLDEETTSAQQHHHHSLPTRRVAELEHQQQHPSSPKSPSRIHFITVQTGSSPGWCRNMKSALRSGIHVFNLGWGQKYAHRARPRWIVDFLRSALKSSPYPSSSSEPAFSLDDVILFSDGADTMFTGVDPGTILQRFEHTARAEAGGKRDFVMFNAEANCYHQQLFQEKPWGVNKGRCIGAYKRFDAQRRTKWRYLNAGAWVGTVRAALWLFSNVTKKLDANQKLWCDQSVIGGLMLGEGPLRAAPPPKRLILLDTANIIFLPTYHLTKKDVCAGAGPVGEEDLSPYDAKQLRRLFGEPESLVLCHSRSAAAVLHFNGKSGSSGAETERRANEFIAKKRGKALSSDSELLLWDSKPNTRASNVVAFGTHCPKFVKSS